jgi:hypothetical protein
MFVQNAGMWVKKVTEKNTGRKGLVALNEKDFPIKDTVVISNDGKAIAKQVEAGVVHVEINCELIRPDNYCLRIKNEEIEQLHKSFCDKKRMIVMYEVSGIIRISFQSDSAGKIELINNMEGVTGVVDYVEKIVDDIMASPEVLEMDVESSDFYDFIEDYTSKAISNK